MGTQQAAAIREKFDIDSVRDAAWVTMAKIYDDLKVLAKEDVPTLKVVVRALRELLDYGLDDYIRLEPEDEAVQLHDIAEQIEAVFELHWSGEVLFHCKSSRCYRCPAAAICSITQLMQPSHAYVSEAEDVATNSATIPKPFVT